MTDAHIALTWVSRLISLAIVFQSIEFIKMKESISETGIWRWSDLKEEYLFLPDFILGPLNWLMHEKRFIEMMKIRFYLAFLSVFFPHFLIIFITLFITTFLITLRWRGSFNGGSDYLTLIILLCVCVALIHPIFTKPALWYLSLQVISSYFVAGLYKIKKTKWRLGTAIYGFVSSPLYKTPKFIIEQSKKPNNAQKIAWLIIGFELTFPLVLTHPLITSSYLIMGALFHLSNFIIFGLNRFFWTWCASYPALYYCAKLV